MTLLLAGLAVSTFVFVLDFFLFEGEAEDDVFLLKRDFFSIDTVVPPGSNLTEKKRGNSMRRCLPFICRLAPYQISFLSVASFSVESLAVASLATASLLAAVDLAGCSGFPPLGPSLLGFALAAPLSDFFWIAIFVT
jgi:hypothetical protein